MVAALVEDLNMDQYDLTPPLTNEEMLFFLCRLYRDNHPGQLVSDFDLAALLNYCEGTEALALCAPPPIVMHDDLCRVITILHDGYTGQRRVPFRDENLFFKLILATGVTAGYVQCVELENAAYAWQPSAAFGSFESRLLEAALPQDDPWLVNLRDAIQWIGPFVAPRGTNDPLSHDEWLRAGLLSIAH